jgi:thioredoxin-like negative regulator of GroEL
MRVAFLASILALGCNRSHGAPADAGTEVLHAGIPWFEDDLEAAERAARARGLPLFVDLWAPWCHTCLSMRSFVLTAEQLAPVRDRVVFAALDTERAANAPALARLPIGAWPTFYVLAGDGRVHGRWVGAASAEEMVQFVESALRSVASQDAAPDSALARRVAGDRAMAHDDFAQASAAYSAALAAPELTASERPAVLVGLVNALYQLDDGACAALGVAELAHAGDTASASDFAARVLQCAEALPADDARRRQARDAARAVLTRLCEQGSPSLSADDRGDACGTLAGLLDALGEPGAARAVHAHRLALLETAARGKEAAVAHTFDFARAESMVALGRGEQALALLSERERALPSDYSPPHFLARTYRDLGRYAEGLSAVERALAKATGPRRAGMLGLKADLQLGLGDMAGTRITLLAQRDAYRSLPPGQAQPRRADAVQRRLDALSGPRGPHGGVPSH